MIFLLLQRFAVCSYGVYETLHPDNEFSPWTNFHFRFLLLASYGEPNREAGFRMVRHHYCLSPEDTYLFVALFLVARMHVIVSLRFGTYALVFVAYTPLYLVAGTFGLRTFLFVTLVFVVAMSLVACTLLFMVLLFLACTYSSLCGVGLPYPILGKNLSSLRSSLYAAASITASRLLQICDSKAMKCAYRELCFLLSRSRSEDHNIGS
jgi:hypothetical protein